MSWWRKSGRQQGRGRRSEATREAGRQQVSGEGRVRSARESRRGSRGRRSGRRRAQGGDEEREARGEIARQVR